MSFRVSEATRNLKGEIYMSNTKKVVLVSHQFSVVVKSMEKSLKELQYDVILMEDDYETLTLSLGNIDALLLYLQDSVLSNHKKVKELFLLCDTLKDMDKKMFLIGTDQDKDVFMKGVPGFVDFPWFSRPVDMKALIKEMETEIKRQATMKEKKKILIIDDDPFYAKMISEFLKVSYTVDLVEDGMKGIAYLAANKVDLILLDYEMPVVDGPKILEMLKMHPDTARIPVIFLTGIGTKESIKRVLSLKPQGYVLKTTTSQDLLKTLDVFFEKQKMGNK